ncbi:RNA polymerase sigma factor [Edaphosphingomonas haloaromaticamans]|uniref:Putative RNA polymerase sigma factor FecI n=1 Tax=Edaphosphingomonas haloaromaticamans TaxID=653954 RepID=A0A1S1HHI3_9SPHN|nr:RNA polymerase sigma factor [Sphingomonas haloaromaticamans]OHT21695.1 putative RNA polymerase sigma factor FecI [Sphingomonas haloaromaticamans]
MIDDSEPLQPAQASEFDASFQATNQSPVEQLLALLEIEYEALQMRLSAHLRSSEAAAEALHDVYVKLRADPSIVEVRNPRSYLYRMAINLAHNQRRKNNRICPADEAAITELPDTAPDPERRAIAADEMSRALDALDALPAKRREIFLAKWRDEKSQIEIAHEFGLHKRSVQKELAKAEQYLRKAIRRSGWRLP